MKTQTTIKVLAFILAVSVLLFGSIGITGVAAQSAIPGDALYPVKTTIENTRLSLAQNAGDRAQMKLTFAEQRLNEISRLISEGRYREIREAVLAFEANINAAILELETVSKTDPARAVQIAQELTAALTRYAQTLSTLAATAPDNVKPEVSRALDTTNIAAGLGRASENENSNANDNDDDNSDDNSNDNSRDDMDDDDSSNSNTSDDDSSNSNTSDDDSSNSNDNDDNSNTRDDDSSSNDDDDDDYNNGIDDDSNANGDDDGNDDSYNDNSDSDDDSNDNSGNDDDSNDNDSGSDDDSNDNDSGSDDDSNDDNSGSDDDNGNDDDEDKGDGSDD